MTTSIPQNNDIVARVTNTSATLSHESEVEHAYQMVLGRNSDADGKTFWVHELETNHINYAELINHFSTSTEGQAHARAVDGSTTPLTTTTLSIDNDVEQAYRIVLGRDSDADGKAFWVHELETGHINYAELINNFYASAEGREIEVEHAYQTALGRNSDTDGKTFWVHELETRHIDHTTLINNLSSSAEGQEFEVEHAYQTVLGRNSDADGKAFWVHELQTGHIDHATLINNLSASAEGQAHISLTGVQTVSHDPAPHG